MFHKRKQVIKYFSHPLKLFFTLKIIFKVFFINGKILMLTLKYFLNKVVCIIREYVN